jgi:hypothetical protein
MTDEPASLLNFPATFCCNCGDTDCATEIQDTRISRAFGLAGVETTFQLAIPVCSVCHKTTRRRPASALSRMLAWVLTTCILLGALLALDATVTLPLWMTQQLPAIAAGISLVGVVLFYRVRRPRPPQTSWYQPVRIRQARVRFGDGAGQVAFMKLAFTNPDYLNVFATANHEAIQAKTLAAVRA